MLLVNFEPELKKKFKSPPLPLEISQNTPLRELAYLLQQKTYVVTHKRHILPYYSYKKRIPRVKT
jgi:hypothetical protein